MVKKAKKSGRAETTRFEWPYGTKNYMIFGAGILSIILGYITLGYGSISWAPVLLILGYCVLIPVSIILKDKKKSNMALDDVDD